VSAYFGVDARRQSQCLSSRGERCRVAAILSNVKLAQLELEVGNGSRAERASSSRNSARRQTGYKTLRMVLLWNLCHQAVASFQRRGGDKCCDIFTDGAFIASGGGASTVYIRPVGKDGAVKHAAPHAGPIWSLDYSPDARMIVAACEQALIALESVRSGRISMANRVWRRAQPI